MLRVTGRCLFKGLAANRHLGSSSRGSPEQRCVRSHRVWMLREEFRERVWELAELTQTLSRRPRTSGREHSSASLAAGLSPPSYTVGLTLPMWSVTETLED